MMMSAVHTTANDFQKKGMSTFKMGIPRNRIFNASFYSGAHCTNDPSGKR